MRPAAVVAAAIFACAGLGLASSPDEPPSQVTWGLAVNGLQCALSLRENDLRVGDSVVAEVTIRNVSDRPVFIHYVPGYYEGEHLVIEGAQGPIRASKSGISEGLSGEPPFEWIAPGSTFTTSITGRAALGWVKPAYLAPTSAEQPIALDFRDTTFTLGPPGAFTVRFQLSGGDEATALGTRYGIAPVWTGSVQSNVVPFRVRPMAREELDRVIDELRNGTAEGRARAVQVALANGDRQALPALVEAMSAGVAGASEAVGALGDSSLVPRLMQMYREAQFDDQKEAVLGALQMVSRDVFGFFAEVVNSDPSEVSRRTAAYRLAEMACSGEIDATHELLAVLGTPDSPPKWGAIDGLALLEGDTRRTMIVTGLITAMKSDADGSVRGRAADALGQIGEAAVVPALITALADPDLWVGASAASSLGRLAGPEAIAPLRQYQQRAQTESQRQAATEAVTAIEQRARAAGDRSGE